MQVTITHYTMWRNERHYTGLFFIYNAADLLARTIHKLCTISLVYPECFPKSTDREPETASILVEALDPRFIS